MRRFTKTTDGDATGTTDRAAWSTRMASEPDHWQGDETGVDRCHPAICPICRIIGFQECNPLLRQLRQETSRHHAATRGTYKFDSTTVLFRP